jgi:hypothetical protein
MTNAEAKLGGGSVVREEPISERAPNAAAHLRLLARTLPNADNPSEQAVFAAAFVRELEKASPEMAYLKAVETLAAFRQADLRYREGHLDWSPPYR